MLQGEAKEGSLLEHLEELRAVIVRMLLSVALIFPAVFYFSDALLGIMLRELCPPGMTLKFFSPVEPLMVQLKIGFYGAIFVAAPYLLMKIWGFVAPGLYQRERSVVGWLTFACWLLFVVGAAFSILVILPLVMKFSFTFETIYLQAAIGIGQFVSLVLMLVLGFGLMFQFPVGIFVVVATGLLDIKRLRASRSYVFLGIFIVSALLTPPDIFSQVLMGLPTYLLFEVGLLAASLTVRGNKDLMKKKAETDLAEIRDSEHNYESVYGEDHDKNEDGKLK